MTRFGSIESRHGVDEPGYVPPEREVVELDQSEIGHSLSLLEATVAALIPLAGLGLAVWRFGRNDIGPGFADLLMACFGTALWLALALAS